MARRLYIVSYDIRSPKRWRRVFARMKRAGSHRQYSVFLVKTDAKGLKTLATDLEQLIDPRVDSILLAPLGRGPADRMTELGVKGEMPGAQLLII